MIAPESVPLARILGEELGRFVKSVHEARFGSRETPGGDGMDYVMMRGAGYRDVFAVRSVEALKQRSDDPER